MKKITYPLIVLILLLLVMAFRNKKSPVTSRTAADKAALRWADSVWRTMDKDHRIAQLIMIRAKTVLDSVNIDSMTDLVRDKGVGGLVFFQGGPVEQAELTNYYQSVSKIPLFIAMDGEWGLGMRLDSVISFPHQMELGAIADSTLIRKTGAAIGLQCRRMGVQINFAPVVDINSDPDNPVIGDRSYGENKYRVADWGVQYMLGLQSQGIIACAKHFPGHGDTKVDSHIDLPVIDKSMAQLEDTELYPFEAMFRAGVDAVMVAHLSVPAIDPTPHLPTSLSKKNVTFLLQRKLHFHGLIFTDALEMKGVTKYFQNGDAALKAFQAGNDILLLPENFQDAVHRIRQAADQGIVSWRQINLRVKKVLVAKYKSGLAVWTPVDTTHLVEDLNTGTTELKKQLDQQAITVLSNDNRILPMGRLTEEKIACLGVGLDSAGSFAADLNKYRHVDDYYFPAAGTYGQAALVAQTIKAEYDQVIIGVHRYSRVPEDNFGLTQPEIQLVNQLEQEMRSVTVVFGNPYAIRNFSGAPAIIAAYEDDSTMHQEAADLIFGGFTPEGHLPVSVCERFAYGAGLKQIQFPQSTLPQVRPEEVGMDSLVLERIDTIAREAISQGATPGLVVLAARNGKIFLDRAYGTLNYEDHIPVTPYTSYDLASVTKVCATTMACMRLYDQGKLKLDKTLGDYLPWLRGSDKAGLKIRDVMLHQAGLVAWIPFYQATLTDGIHPDSAIYSPIRDSVHCIRVAENLYMRKDYLDTMNQRIRDSKLGPRKYVYSDNDFILMAKIVERLTGQPLNQYVQDTFYNRLGMVSTGFFPREKLALDNIAPTECEKYFRLQCLHGDVHDPGAAMFGGVAGHAGLFSDAGDLAVLMQMMLDSGSFEGVQYIQPQTVKLFTAYNSKISRRGLGWDKPERNRQNDPEPYPCRSCSPETFGHLGFTGTCIWVDPKYKLSFIFLSNRVCPDGGSNLKLSQMLIRGRMMQTLYDAMKTVK
ncbi:MAG TPA: glycoside hydrolase family 3 N-terminal domain-containing protein [Chitinophagaceae bacterium]|nr:glycoside hydrolase family 3 N-terminal domain-containing protein [Chitinophagaceae bacterium]